MHYSFVASKSSELTFNVGIAGTSSAPQTVAVVLEKGSTALSYAATKSEEGWTAVIDNPGSIFGTGQVKMSINVVLNNRLFTPMKSVADIIEELEPAEVVPELPPKPPVEVAPEVEVLPPEPPVEIKKPLTPIDLKSIFQTEDVKPPIHIPKSKPIYIPKLKPLMPKKLVEKAPVVNVSQPVHLQLLKSIEPGVIRQVEKVVEQAKMPVKSANLFKLKKTKIVYK